MLASGGCGAGGAAAGVAGASVGQGEAVARPVRTIPQHPSPFHHHHHLLFHHYSSGFHPVQLHSLPRTCVRGLCVPKSVHAFFPKVHLSTKPACPISLDGHDYNRYVNTQKDNKHLIYLQVLYCNWWGFAGAAAEGCRTSSCMPFYLCCTPSKPYYMVLASS